MDNGVGPARRVHDGFDGREIAGGEVVGVKGDAAAVLRPRPRGLHPRERGDLGHLVHDDQRAAGHVGLLEAARANPVQTESSERGLL